MGEKERNERENCQKLKKERKNERKRGTEKKMKKRRMEIFKSIRIEKE